MTRAALPLLLSLAAVLGGALYLESGIGMPDPGRVYNHADAALIPLTRDSTPPDQASSWTDTILGRPLFSPSRRPPEAAVSVKAARTELPRLAGVLVSETGVSAIFAAPGKKPILAKPGDRVGPYLVRSIAAGQVTVVGPSGVAVLHPTFAVEAPGGTPPPPAAVAPSSAQPPRGVAGTPPPLPTQDFIRNVLKEQREGASK